MKSSETDFEAQYRSALQDYLAEPGEAVLHRAYELGRKALDDGLGVLDMALLYHRALVTLSAARGHPQKDAGFIKSAESFFVESLAPFEMTHRAVREANSALHRLNERFEVEAKRIAHALHDEAGQFLTCVHITLDEISRDFSFPPDPRLKTVKTLLGQIEEQLRRFSHELRPTILDDLGLLPALEFLAGGVSQRAGIPVTVDGPRNNRLPFAIETVLYRVVQESLTNVSKHARAHQAAVRLWREPHTIRCSVSDDGVGFDMSAVMAKSGERGLGLIGIRERLEALGGTVRINTEPGHGTQVLITVPVET
jgi:signal transduction histidine kinase